MGPPQPPREPTVTETKPTIMTRKGWLLPEVACEDCVWTSSSFLGSGANDEAANHSADTGHVARVAQTTITNYYRRLT